MSRSGGAIRDGVQDDETARVGPSGAPGIPAACYAWAHRRTRVPRVGGAVREQQEGGEGRKEKGREKGEKKKGEREKGKREKKKRREGKRKEEKKIKGGAGGIRDDGREPGVASMRSDAHEKRGEWGRFK